MADEKKVIAHRLTATNRSGQVVSVQFVSPDKARYATKLLFEEGFKVESTEVDKLPEGVSLDVE